MNFDYNKATIFLTVVGSQSYGLATPESDVDIKGIAIPPIEYKFGYLNRFDQKDSWKDMPDLTTNTTSSFCEEVMCNPPKDRVVYDLAKFIKLASDCNPNMIEVLFTDERFHLYVDPIFKQLLDIKDSFISKKCFKAFQGYAISQLNRIKVAKKWLDNPPTHRPNRVEFGLPENKKVLSTSANGAFNKLFAEMLEVSGLRHEKQEFVEQFMDINSETYVDWLAMVQKLSDRSPSTLEPLVNNIAEIMDLTPKMMRIITREKEYRAANKRWDDYIKWKTHRNPKRAELEEKFKYDSKHALHLCRLILMCQEMLSGKGVNVFRNGSRSFLRDVRAGMFTFDELVKWADNERELLKELYERTKLPKLPDHDLIQKVCINMYQQYYKQNT